MIMQHDLIVSLGWYDRCRHSLCP